jgi:hypothetical protein
MDFKRKIFILLSLVALTAPLIVTYFYPLFNKLGLVDYFLVPILFHLCYVLIQIMGSFIYALTSESGPPDVDEYCSFLLGTLLFNQKRIYYSDLGYFYMSGKSRLTIWKQGYFVSHKLFHVYYGGDIEAVRQAIKVELETRFQRELEENQRRKLLKDWNGNLDKKSDRDDKLNQLLS